MNSKNDKKKDKSKIIKLFNWDELNYSENNSDLLNFQKEGNKKSISDEFLMEDNWDTNEQIYKDEIIKIPWIKNNEYLNVTALEKNLPSFHYFDKNCSILESALTEKTFQNLIKEPNFKSQPNTKKMGRRGISPNYMHQFLISLFDIKEIDKSHYDTSYSIIFKNHDTKYLGDFVPYFSNKKTLKENLPIHFLNDEGIEQLKIILWMIGDAYRNISFSPIIVKLISLILLFCNKYETYEIMCKIIEQDSHINEENEYKIRWRLKFSHEENKKLISSIAQSLKEISPKNRTKYYQNLDSLFFNVEEIYEDMCFNFFLNHFNFYGVIRLLPFYLIEGVKSFYRIIYAIETQIYNIELTTKNEVIQKIRDKCKKLDIQELFNISFKFNLTRYNNKYISQKEEESDLLINKRNDFYLPDFKGGNILTDYEIIHLWQLLPFEYKIKNASIIYQASKDGYNLPNIINMEEKYDKNLNVLFLIETKNGEKFGFISSNLIIHTDNKYYRPTSSVLFTIKPEFQIYTPIDDSDEILYVTNKDFIFGNGENGPAIQLSQDLKEGDSYCGGCFNNPCLVSDPYGHFSVQKLEIFKLE